MATKRKFPEDDTFLFTATTTAKSSGDICLMTEMVGIALVDISAGSTGAVAVRGVWSLNKVTTEPFTVGDSAYYPPTPDYVTVTATTTSLYCGKVYTAATTTEAAVDVVLNLSNAGAR
jgi:predicted RecA/RadA family phage recombinase